jgi:hypothetical protein
VPCPLESIIGQAFRRSASEMIAAVTKASQAGPWCGRHRPCAWRFRPTAQDDLELAGRVWTRWNDLLDRVLVLGIAMVEILACGVVEHQRVAAAKPCHADVLLELSAPTSPLIAR